MATSKQTSTTKQAASTQKTNKAQPATNTETTDAKAAQTTANTKAANAKQASQTDAEAKQAEVKKAAKATTTNAVNKTSETSTATADEKTKVVDTESTTYIKQSMKQVNSVETAYELFRNTGKLKDLVVGIKQYKDFITGPKKENPNEYVSQNYRFYNIVIKHLNDENYSRFKLKMDLFLKILNSEKDKQLNIINILKYDHFWKYGQKTRISYYLLMTFLEGLANPNTRKKELKTIDINKLASYVPEQVMINFRRYFNI